MVSLQTMTVSMHTDTVIVYNMLQHMVHEMLHMTVKTSCIPMDFEMRMHLECMVKGVLAQLSAVHIAVHIAVHMVEEMVARMLVLVAVHMVEMVLD